MRDLKIQIEFLSQVLSVDYFTLLAANFTRRLETKMLMAASGPLSTCHAHETNWSTPMQISGQVECRRVGKYV